MRDLLLLTVLLGGIPVTLWRPFYGVCIFAWISLMNPHRLTWGITYDMPWAMLYAGSVFLAVWFRERPLLVDSLKRYILIGIYVAWMGITTLDAADPESAGMRYVEALKIHLMAFITLTLLNSHWRVRIFSTVIILSIAFFGFKGGIFTILTAGESRVWGPPASAIADNNHLAAGLIVIIPLVYWLHQITTRRLLRILLSVGLLLIIISVLGSKSRGAFVGIVMMTLFLVVKARHRFRLLAGIAVFAAVAIPIMPSSYWERIDSIDSYNEDASAQGRINSWITAYRIANVELTGGGFDYYGSWLYLEHAPNPLSVHSAHSVYFQALGEHGWIGLGLYLLIFVQLWFQCSKIAKIRSTFRVASEDQLLARMLQVSLIGFMASGAFVNIGNWDMVFYLAIVIFALARQNEARIAEEGRENATAGHSATSKLARGFLSS